MKIERKIMIEAKYRRIGTINGNSGVSVFFFRVDPSVRWREIVPYSIDIPETGRHTNARTNTRGTAFNSFI